MLVPRLMGEKIAKYQDGVAIGRIDRHGGCIVETDAPTFGLCPGKFGPELPSGEEPVEANIFANPFSKMSSQCPCDFCTEGWI